MKKIGIAGAGGIGSHLTSLLFDYGVNRKQFDFNSYDIFVFDNDIVDTKNLLHQNFKMSELGKKKVDIMEKRYAVTGVDRFMTADDFKDFDLIFSCVDGMEFRAALYKYSWQKDSSIFWIDGRCVSKRGVVASASVERGLLELLLDDSTERAGCLLAAEKENNISHVLPLIVAGAMCQVFLNYLRKENPLKSEKLFNFNA